MMGGDDPEARTDDKGYFILNGLPPGQIRLAVEHRDYLDDKVEEVRVIRRETNTIPKVELVRGGTIHGIVYDDNGEATVHAMVMIRKLNEEGNSGRPQIAAVENGAYSQGGLAAGTYHLTVQRFGGGGPVRFGGDSEPDAVVEISAGQTVEKNIRP